jgi:hypothetical protein
MSPVASKHSTITNRGGQIHWKIGKFTDLAHIYVFFILLDICFDFGNRART